MLNKSTLIRIKKAIKTIIITSVFPYKTVKLITLLLLTNKDWLYSCEIRQKVLSFKGVIKRFAAFFIALLRFGLVYRSGFNWLSAF
jgi:hypothetical protein